MGNNLRSLANVFSAGALGALANSIALWLLGGLGITALMGLAIAPPLSPGWLYPRIVWGGIWGVLFLLPVLTRSWFLRGLLFSLGPTLVQLFVVFPFKTTAGVLGLGIGPATPLLVLVVNAVWGLVAAYTLRLMR